MNVMDDVDSEADLAARGHQYGSYEHEAVRLQMAVHETSEAMKEELVKYGQRGRKWCLDEDAEPDGEEHKNLESIMQEIYAHSGRFYVHYGLIDAENICPELRFAEEDEANGGDYLSNPSRHENSVSQRLLRAALSGDDPYKPSDNYHPSALGKYMYLVREYFSKGVVLAIFAGMVQYLLVAILFQTLVDAIPELKVALYGVDLSTATFLPSLIVSTVLGNTIREAYEGYSDPAKMAHRMYGLLKDQATGLRESGIRFCRSHPPERHYRLPLDQEEGMVEATLLAAEYHLLQMGYLMIATFNELAVGGDGTFVRMFHRHREAYTVHLMELSELGVINPTTAPSMISSMKELSSPLIESSRFSQDFTPPYLTNNHLKLVIAIYMWGIYPFVIASASHEFFIPLYVVIMLMYEGLYIVRDYTGQPFNFEPRSSQPNDFLKWEVSTVEHILGQTREFEVCWQHRGNVRVKAKLI